MGYKSEQLAEGLLVKDVELMSYMLPPEKGLTEPIDEGWFEAAVKLFDERKANGKLARVKLGHKAEAPVIGRVVRLEFRKPWLRGDLLLTEPSAIEAYKRGEFPSLSSEFVALKSYPLFWGVALIGGDAGHFDEERPDFVPEELSEKLKALSASIKRCSVVPAEPAEEKPGVEQTRKQLEEALLRISNLEKALQQQAAKEMSEKAGQYEEPADKQTKENPMAEESKQAAPEKAEEGTLAKEPAPVEEPAASAEEKEPKKELAAEVLAEGEHKLVKLGAEIRVLAKTGEVKIVFPLDKEAYAREYFTVLEHRTATKKLLDAVKSLKDTGCPVQVGEILTRLTAAKSEAEFESVVTTLKSIPKWQDLAKSDGAKLDASGKSLTAQEQVKLFLAKCDSEGMPRNKAVLKLAKENPELFKAWTGHAPR